jgi:3-hydroxyisobutyrate dehydrogenase-like beta-hydroxyacid dehydrogenase
MGDQVAVIGLGRMGFALAACLLQNDYKVTVWNRTASKAAPLLKDGAVQGESAVDAVARADVVVTCLGNYDDTETVLADCGELGGKTLIQLTSGSIAEGEQFQEWAQEKGALYLDGVISAYPSGIGKTETMLVVAGSEKAWSIAEPVIMCLGGSSRYVGESLMSPVALQFALIAPTLMVIMGMIQGVHVLEREGFDLKVYAEIISGMSSLLVESIGHQVNAIANDNYADTEAALETWEAGLKHYFRSFDRPELNLDLMMPVGELLRKAVTAGYGGEEIAAVIKVLRQG